MSHKGFTHLVVRSSLIALLISVPMGSGCVEAGLQSGVFACDADSDCPPGGFFCDNYFNNYIYLIDVNARPTVHGFWGSCISTNEVVVKEGTGADRVFAEKCHNGVDDDGDELVDCLDPECQTARACRNRVDAECLGLNPSEWCAARLGYPLTRDQQDPSDANCPASVGYSLSHDPQSLCLPRCRLYFKGTPAGTNNIFGGSDQYCNEVYGNRFSTDDEFAGSMVCTHLYVEVNAYKGNVQHDVCLPSAALTRTGCDGGLTAVPIEYRDRTMLAEPVLTPNSGTRKGYPALKPADNTLTITDDVDYDDTVKTAYVCVPAK